MRWRLGVAAFALVAVVALGSAGYVLIEGWPLFDALYMTVITVSTVGFAEIGELSQLGRMFTIVLIFLGFGALVFALGTFIDFIVEGHLRTLLEGRRMQINIDKLADHHIVAGIGRVGVTVASALAEEGVQFAVIEHDEEAVAAAREEGWLVIAGDATDEDVLREAGIERARSLATALDTDADNLFVTISARSLNPELFIVARSSHESSEAKLRRAGANRVLTPNVTGGRRMAAMVLHPVVTDYLDMVTHGGGVEFRLQEVHVTGGCAFEGRSIRDAQVRDRTGAYILAIQGPDGGINTNPSPDTPMCAGDRLVVLGTTSQIDALVQAM